MARALKIALPTCATLPAWERDDEPLHAALRARAVELERPIWDDPSVAWDRFDLVLIRTTWDYQGKREAFVEWAERVAAQTRLYNPPALVRWNTDKLYLRELEAAGVALAPSLWFEPGEAVALADAAAQLGVRRGFCKPRVAANSRGTIRFDAREPASLAAAQAQLDALLAREPMLVQPYLSAVETEGELSAIVFDGRLSHAVRKVPVPGDYRVQDDHGARDMPITLEPEALALVEATLAGLARVIAARGWAVELPLLYARIDMLRSESGAFVLNELEVVEPSLFLRHGPAAAERLADALLARVARAC